jgi:hypothetical protein
MCTTRSCRTDIAAQLRVHLRAANSAGGGGGGGTACSACMGSPNHHAPTRAIPQATARAPAAAVATSWALQQQRRHLRQQMPPGKAMSTPGQHCRRRRCCLGRAQGASVTEGSRVKHRQTDADRNNNDSTTLAVRRCRCCLSRAQGAGEQDSVTANAHSAL